MKYVALPLISLILLCLPASAQVSPDPQPAPAPPGQVDLGKWWKNSEVVRDLGLGNAQIEEIERIFLDHRVQLVDLHAEEERQEARLRPLMEADRQDADKVAAQVDQMLAAKARLEKANIMMMIAIRRVLTVEQWKKLQSIQGKHQPTAPVPAREPGSGGEDVVYTVGGRVRPPKAIAQPIPTYTAEAKEGKIEGLILLEAIIRKDGTVAEVKVLRGLGYGLDESAINTVKNRWKFSPATLDGEPVAVRANIEISFRLY